jgi:hypothetical protein
MTSREQRNRGAATSASIARKDAGL